MIVVNEILPRLLARFTLSRPLANSKGTETKLHLQLRVAVN